MPLYAKVDREACIACGLCQMLAPTLFDYDADGLASYTPDHNTGTTPLTGAQAIVFRRAYTRCPTGAIHRQAAPFSSDEP
ncbi:ferredoxin [Lacticaseibacillus daqingensis]|uniref:ferredoxin n=1 Tax=Lacticaseibacillus daqingensis TaxID=2486014 RepID=UPI000F77328B|nr:ferredoxin [Lacticaseibacillus daqingensis]